MVGSCVQGGYRTLQNDQAVEFTVEVRGDKPRAIKYECLRVCVLGSWHKACAELLLVCVSSFV